MIGLPDHPRLRRLDLLSLPLIRPLVRWRYARLIFQLPLLFLCLLAIYDGFSGSRLPGLNVATISVWVHYRGLLVTLLALLGNLFCAACPLMLMRGPSRALKRLTGERAWPRALRNKYLVLGLTALFFFVYEAALLWSSPVLTAGLMVMYFLAILVVDAAFAAGTFCKYVCPLGNYNMLLSGASPTVIAARDPSVCASCAGKYCLNGRSTKDQIAVQSTTDLHGLQTLPMFTLGSTALQSGVFPGCETQLYVPTIRGNQDCTLCLNCVRACPHDNVVLAVRSPLQEATQRLPRLDWSLLVLVVAWGGLLNALAMTPPFTLLLDWLSLLLHTRVVTLLLIPGILSGLALGAMLSVGAARLARVSLRELAPTLVPVTSDICS